LLDASQLAVLRQAATTLPPLLQQRLVKQARLGERPSSIRGSGLDYDESRSFIAGDDRRHINWRLYARTGEPHLKLFHEERRPQLMLLLDRRSAMRMGSRQRLKLTQGVRLAALLAFWAEAVGMAVGALCLQANSLYQGGRHDEAAVMALVRALSAAAPPVSSEAEPSLAQALAQLQRGLAPGRLVCLISDFSDLEAGDGALLWQLVREHDVLAFHISDPMEQQLPEAGRLRLDCGEGRVLEVDCGDAALRAAYAQKMQERGQAIERRLLEAGVDYTALSPDEDVVALMSGAGGDGD